MRWVVIALMLWASSARAESPPTRSERYGSTIAICDAASVAVLAAGIAVTASSDGGGARALGVIGIVAGAGGYVFASPIVHYLRDRDQAYKVDLGMRIFVPGLAAGIAAGTASCPDDAKLCDSKTTAIFVAGGIGMAVASTIDIVWFAKQRVPYVAPAPNGVVAGVAGAF